MSRPGVLVLAAASLQAITGCGGGAVAVAASVGGGGGGHPAPPTAPSVAVTMPQGAGLSNYVAVGYKLEDTRVPGNADPRVRIHPQYRRAASDAWVPMTEAVLPQSHGTRDLELRVNHVFVWNTLVDLGGSSRLGGVEGTVEVLVQADYEEAAGIRRDWRPGTAGEDEDNPVVIDNRLGATVFGADVTPPPAEDTEPVDIRPDGDGFLVADEGANIVERVDAQGQVVRVAGFGVPGPGPADGSDPGVAKLPPLSAMERDPAGNLYTDHFDRLIVTNRGSTNLSFGRVDGPDADAAPDTIAIPPRTVATAPIPGLDQSRCVRLHPSGALLITSRLPAGGFGILAVNPQDPADPGSASIVVGTASVGPGEIATLAGGGSDSSDGVAGPLALVEDAVSLAIGPDGEIYYAEGSLARVRVLNSTPSPLTIGGRVMAPGTVATVAGGNGVGFAGDTGPAVAARLNTPRSIDVSPSRLLFIAETFRVRVVNLADAQQPYAQIVVGPGDIDTAVGGGSLGAGSRPRTMRLTAPRAVATDASGNLLVADKHEVILVNYSSTTITAYGRTLGPARTASVYDSTQRFGIPPRRPRAAHLRTQDASEVFFTDLTTVRVLNLDANPSSFGGVTADPGGVAILAGGATQGFSGDGGPAASAGFDTPSALASAGPFNLYVADTGNDRIRFLNLDDPISGAARTVFGVTAAPGDVDTIVGGAPGPLPKDGDGLDPRACSLSRPLGIAVSTDGLLLIADTGHHRIRVANPGPADATVAGVSVPANTIGTLLGTGAAGFTPDGPGPWALDTPTAIAVDRDLVYFAESGNARIRVLNVSAAPVHVAGVDVAPGEVATIVGTGVRENAGDGGTGTSARIDSPRAFFLQTKGGTRAALYFTDGPQQVLRLLNLTDTDISAATGEDGDISVTVPGATMVTLAGGPNTPGFTNPPAFEGDGEEAARMRFSDPWGVVVTAKGKCLTHLFIMDQGNDRVRRFGAPPVRQCSELP